MQPNPSENQSLMGSNQAPYPGYGQRHDIFYQYQPPAPGSRAVRPQFNPADLARKPTEMPKIDDTNPYETSNSHKGILITAALVLSCLAAIGVFFLVKQGGKTPSSNNANSQNNSAATANPNVVSTLCYGFSLPLPHGAVPTENSCTGTYTTGSETITVNPVFYSTDLNGMVALWKQNNPNLQIVGETQFTLDNKNADGVLYTDPTPTSGSTANQAQTLSVLVFTGVNAYGAGYNIQGTPISGFEIKGAYSDQDTTKQSFDEVLSSWVWK